ncbi:MAG: hypothetical protein PVJ86_04000 [Phycisphaerales bacterium]|jgi:hypothetical protein
MSRPLSWYKEDEKFLEYLEGAAGCVPSIVDKTDLLNLRLKQIGRRVERHYLRRVVEPAIDQVKELVDEVDELRQLLHKALKMLQDERNEK